MLADYFKGDGVRVLTVVVALFHSISWCTVKEPQGFYLILTDGMLGVNVGMWLLSIVVFIYVASGGLRAVAYVDTLQCIMKGIK